MVNITNGTHGEVIGTLQGMYLDASGNVCVSAWLNQEGMKELARTYFSPDMAPPCECCTGPCDSSEWRVIQFHLTNRYINVCSDECANKIYKLIRLMLVRRQRQARKRKQ